jgi:hypothetical protein
MDAAFAKEIRRALEVFARFEERLDPTGTRGVKRWEGTVTCTNLSRSSRV